MRAVRDDDVDRAQVHRRRRHSRALLIARPFFSPGFGLRAVGCLSSRACFFVIQAATAAGSHLFPSRTEQLSPRAPMVLRHSGRVGRRRFPQAPRSLKRSRGAFYGYVPDGFAGPWKPLGKFHGLFGGKRQELLQNAWGVFRKAGFYHKHMEPC